MQLGTIAAVAGLLAIHYALAAHSLMLENPTVDEVAHMPAGITYWQKGTFRLYHHNPPLVKLVAALPVVLSRPITDPLYQSQAWRSRDPSQASFAQLFAYINADRYFELFQLARLPMPLFSIIGGLAVWAWSRRMYGPWGGLLSLALWVFCPNILAHARLVTSDLGSTALGVAATYLFWRYLHQPTWRWAALAGIALGFAQLTKFSMLLLYLVWPFLWLVRLLLAASRAEWKSAMPRGLFHGALIIAASILVIDAGYLFERVGIPLGAFEFGSKSLTRPVPPGAARPHSKNPLLEATWQFRVNRFRGSWLGGIPCPLPEHYVLGFDEQKIETEGVPRELLGAVMIQDEAAKARAVQKLRSVPESALTIEGYPVYLDGELERTGWRHYYLLALAYKVPEGTWFLVILSVLSLRLVPRSSSQWGDEITLATVPVVVLFSMSFLTDINLGLRYVLSMFPYVFIAVGKLAPLALGLSGARKWVMAVLVTASLGSSIAATALIHPHYLAYFNWASGGPEHEPAHLIDSNLDWGQDLIALQKWWEENIPNERLGLAYFGQINPSIFRLRGERFDWFLPPVPPNSTTPVAERPDPMLVGPAKKLTAGYYAVSASLVYGLPWRLYDPAPPELDKVPAAWGAAWHVHELNAFWYFRQFEPVRRIGHSIYIYHLSEEHVARAAPILFASDPQRDAASWKRRPDGGKRGGGK
jgi:4-amino-4-deoxy-L-arabinose transferase-like glycosyltransferase